MIKSRAKAQRASGDGVVPLEAVAVTKQLKRRPARPPDFVKQTDALLSLAQAMADAPQTILQKLAETILDVLNAHTAGVSLLTADAQHVFSPAIAGAWSSNVGISTPREFSPSSDVLDLNSPLLLKHLERRYTAFRATVPAAEECLLVPFHIQGKAIGTLWAIAHDRSRTFDAEDLRQLQSLGTLAAAAYQAQNHGVLAQQRRTLQPEDADQSRTGFRMPDSESEAFSRSIIESSPDCIKVLDLDGKLLAMHNGDALLGISDCVPFLHTSWINFWEGADRKQAQTAVAAAVAGGEGLFTGFFRTLRDEPKWWEVRVTPILDHTGTAVRLLAVSRDVTETRRAQQNLAFLASIGRELLRWATVDEMMATIGARIGAHLDLSTCAFVEVSESAEQVVIAHDWRRNDVPSLIGVYRLPDFVDERFFRLARAGEIIVVSDVVSDPRTDAAKFTPLRIGSFICAPLLRDHHWLFALCLYKSEAYAWREDEIELARELTARIWSRVERLRAEDAMRASEERYRTLFNLMDEGYCVIEMVFDEHDNPLDFRYIDVNPAFEKQSGMQDVKGKLVSEILPNIEDHWMQTYARVALTGEPIRYVNESGELEGRWFDLYAFRVGAPEQRQVAVLFRNIKARMDAQKALRDSEERYRTLFDSMDEAFCIIEMIVDEHEHPVDYRFVLTNPTFERQTGLRDALGKRMRELVPTLEQHWFDIYGKVAQTGEPIRFVNEAKDMQNRWFDVYACRVGDTQDRKVAIIFNDISERRLTSEALRSSEERYRYLFNSIDEGFCVMQMLFDADDKPVDYRFLEVNPSFENQSGIHGAVGKRILEFAPHMESYWFEKYGHVAVTGEPVRFTNESKELNKWFDVYAFRIGEPASRKVAVIFNDISQRTRSDEMLRRNAQAMADLDRRKDEFLALLGHELRNPLAPIANAVQLLRLAPNENPIQQKARTIIERQVGQLTHLVDDLLEISRINTGRIQLRQQRVPVRGIIERAVETTQPSVREHRHQLTVSLPAGPLWLNADAARLEQVFVNLLANAVKYTDDGGQIWLTIEQEGDSVALRVRDNGIGVTPELLPNIFDLFTQAQRSLARSQGGLGIGLSLVHRLVALHGGTVNVSSVLGEGSEFVVRLPLMRAETPPSPDLTAKGLMAPRQGCGVLIVDDNVDAGRSLGLLLQMVGHDVLVAHDGHSALDAAIRYRPDVVMLDIGLPGLTGLEVAQKIREQPSLKKAVLIAITGYGLDADRLRSREAGFDHHLVKPADFQQLQDILSRVCEVAPLTTIERGWPAMS